MTWETQDKGLCGRSVWGPNLLLPDLEDLCSVPFLAVDRIWVWGATACPALLSFEVASRLLPVLMASSSRRTLGTALPGFLPQRSSS